MKKKLLSLCFYTVATTTSLLSIQEQRILIQNGTICWENGSAVQNSDISTLLQTQPHNVRLIHELTHVALETLTIDEVFRVFGNYMQNILDIALIDAAKAGDAKTLEHLLIIGANPTARDECGYTALHFAKDVSTAKTLCDHGANNNILGHHNDYTDNGEPIKIYETPSEKADTDKRYQVAHFLQNLNEK
jgi:ankyrin repeat protein